MAAFNTIEELRMMEDSGDALAAAFLQANSHPDRSRKANFEAGVTAMKALVVAFPDFFVPPPSLNRFSHRLIAGELFACGNLSDSEQQAFLDNLLASGIREE